MGLTKSLNKLIKFSTGKYIARQDADDLSYKTRLEEQVNFLNDKLSCLYNPSSFTAK